MQYRPYGSTGETVSVIGCGGMRFPDVNNEEACIETLLAAYDTGINYFDTAPGYCKDLSEIRVGQAVTEFKKRPHDHNFLLSTKTWKSDADGVRADIEQSLKRLNVEAIDFYHCWCVNSWEAWQERKAGGAVEELIKIKEEGLARHICVSSHMSGQQISEMLSENIFEGVLLGYSAINAPFRRQGISGAREMNLGVAIMNPLGGGLIPNHADRFDFIKRREDPSLVHSALRYVVSTPGVSLALVGIDSPQHAREAAAVTDDLRLLSSTELSEVDRNVEEGFDQLCTLCGYCDNCPQGIPVPKFMSAYNYQLLEDTAAMKDYLKWHWELGETAPGVAQTCTQCGKCESKCTQHLPIIDRLKHISSLYSESEK